MKRLAVASFVLAVTAGFLALPSTAGGFIGTAPDDTSEIKQAMNAFVGFLKLGHKEGLLLITTGALHESMSEMPEDAFAVGAQLFQNLRTKKIEMIVRGSEASATMTFAMSGETKLFKLKYKLRKVGGRWKIYQEITNP